MNRISDILKSKVFVSKTQKAKQMRLFDTNKRTDYYYAKEYAEYVGVKTSFVLFLIKKYGLQNVLNTKSWIKDYPARGEVYGLLVWKLKNQQSLKVDGYHNSNDGIGSVKMNGTSIKNESLYSHTAM